MKNSLFLCLLWVFGTLHLASPVRAEPKGSASEADVMAADISAQLSALRPPAGLSGEDLGEWIRVNGDALIGRMQMFMARHPQHEKRWHFQYMLVYTTRGFVGVDATVRDAAWAAQRQAYRQEILTSPEAPKRYVREIEVKDIRSDLSLASESAEAGGQPELGSIRRRLDDFAMKWPADMSLGSNEVQFAILQDKLSKAGSTHLLDLLKHANPEVVKAAQAALDRVQKFAELLELAFTAVDGRKVDLKDYRGKVVLVDFWATWCGPCIAEIPNIKKVYAEYRAKGFEIIGIALENARLSAEDSAEQAAAKHEKAKKVLNDFTAKTDMPWPQYYDGKHWKNDLSTRFRIEGIPAMFLIDREGKIVTTNARGEKLEAEVKRLLGL